MSNNTEMTNAGTAAYASAPDNTAAASATAASAAAASGVQPPRFSTFQGASLDDLYQQALKLNQKQVLPDMELSRLTQALTEAQEIMEEHSRTHFVVRKARLSDVDSLQAMVNYWAQQGENLPRSREDLIRNIQSFAVCVKEGLVLGCACLYVYDTGLAEIRSLGVNPSVQRQGQGRAIVEFLLHKAWQYEIKKVFVLTRNPGFFSRVGFTGTTIEALPEKIRKDCEHCNKRERCDEVAFEYNFDYSAAKPQFETIRHQISVG